MKKYIVLSLLLLSVTLLNAQMHNGKFGNEWINYGQSYFKIKIHKDGIHHLNQQVLTNSGVDLSNVNPATLQIFNNGQQIPIHVETSGNVVDFIEFYGEKNRGQLDVNLHDQAHQLFNPEYSLINDTAAYFLTWGSGAQRYDSRATNLANLPNPTEYCWYSSQGDLETYWGAGKIYSIGGVGLSKSSFEQGEGFGSLNAQVHLMDVSTTHAFTTGPQAEIKAHIQSTGNSHNLSIKISNQPLYNSTFTGDSTKTHKFTFSPGILGTTNTTVEMRGNNGSSDRHRVAYVELKYPHTFDFGGQSNFFFELKANNNRQYLLIDNFDASGTQTQAVYLYDLTNKKRIHCFLNNNQIHVDLLASSVDRQLVLINQNDADSYQQVGRLDAVQFTNFNTTTGDYIIISHPSLYQDSEGNNPVLEYAAYRASKGFSPVIVNIEELYNQFAYGVNYHPLAVRNFVAFATQKWNNPQHLFLIGKGRKYNDSRIVSPDNLLIPTFGYPPSDNMLVANIGSRTPSIAVGRLAATDGDQVRVYLEKVKEVETVGSNAAEEIWRKKVLHLGGGATTYQQNYIKQRLEGMQTKIEGKYLGATVYSFTKNSNNPTEVTPSEAIDSLIDNGVAMITFLGHATLQGFDYNLEMPEHYSNKGKYPFITVLGCSNGTHFEQEKLMSEKFVFQPEGGSIGYFGAVAPIALSSTSLFSDRFYLNLSQNEYGKGFGTVIKKTISEMESGTLYNFNTTMEMMCNYMTYQGDPALTLNVSDKPDYYVNSQSVKHSPGEVSLQDDNLELSIDIENLGKATDREFNIKITRQYPDGSKADAQKYRVSAPSNKETIVIKIPLETGSYSGPNHFSIKIDCDKEVVELTEANNSVNYTVYFGNDAIKPVYPAEFAIITEPNVTLRASTGNAFASQQTYAFQIDTTEHFDSPMLEETSITQRGGVIEWTPAQTLEEDVVYYWRVSETGNGAEYWKGSSFVYLQGTSGGWNQSHIFQYQKDDLEYITVTENTPSQQFVGTVSELYVRNGLISALSAERLSTYWNGSLLQKCYCRQKEGVYVHVVLSETSRFWSRGYAPANTGATTCDPNSRDSLSFFFETGTNTGINDLESFLRTTVPQNAYVLIYTLNDAHFGNWAPSLTNHLEHHGSKKISRLVNDAQAMPYAFYYQNGNSGFDHSAESAGESASDVITLSCKIPSVWGAGRMSSTIIGPATDWAELKWSTLDIDPTHSDNSTVRVFGIGEDGSATEIWSGQTFSSLNLQNTTAHLYSYLQLVLEQEDGLHKTPAQLNSWRVGATMAGDLALNTTEDYTSIKTVVNQGDPMSFEIQVLNLGDQSEDSVLVYYELLDTDIMEQQYVTVSKNNKSIIVINIPTKRLSGKQKLHISINSDKAIMERNYFNNSGYLMFEVLDADELQATKDSQTELSLGGQPLAINTIAKENQGVAVSNFSSFPNPFSTETRFSFTLEGSELPSDVVLQIFTQSGTIVKEITGNELGGLQLGENYPDFAWNGTDNSGNILPNGVYFYRMLIVKNGKRIQNEDNVGKTIIAR